MESPVHGSIHKSRAKYSWAPKRSWIGIIHETNVSISSLNSYLLLPFLCPVFCLTILFLLNPKRVILSTGANKVAVTFNDKQPHTFCSVLHKHSSELSYQLCWFLHLKKKNQVPYRWHFRHRRRCNVIFRSGAGVAQKRFFQPHASVQITLSEVVGGARSMDQWARRTIAQFIWAFSAWIFCAPFMAAFHSRAVGDEMKE